MAARQFSPGYFLSFGVPVILCIVAIFPLGCQKAPMRVEVEGTVNLDNEPLSSGTITFAPVKSGQAAQATINQGKFKLSKLDGPAPGLCKVEILSYQKTGRKVPGVGSDGSGMTEELKQIIPDHYNRELEQTLVEGKMNTLTFDLKSR